jgi:hypothetical protein
LIDVNDRVPLYPGRVKMTPVSGQANVYDMVRADQPQKDGTPLNRNTFRQTQADIRAYPIATGNSVTAGDVVDVVNGEVTRSVVAEANVKTRLFTGSTSSTATCRLNDKYSICVYCSIGTTQAYLVDNSSGNLVSTASLGLSAANNLCIARLSDTEFIVGCGYDNAGLTMLGTVSDTSISFGERVTGFGSGSVTVLVPLSSTKVFSLVSRPGGAVASCILTIANSNILLGNVTQFSGIIGSSFRATLLPNDSSGNKRVCVCFSDANDGNKGKAVIATINSSNAVTWGSVVTFNDSASFLISCASNGNTVVVSYANNSACCCRVLAMNGTSIAAGSQTQFEETEIKAESSVVCIGGKFVVCGHGRTSGGAISGSYAIVLNVSGLNITVNTAYKFDPASASYLRACPISDNKLIVAYADNGNSNYGTDTILEVNGNQIAGGFTVNSTQAIALESGEAGQEIEVIFAGTTAADFVTEGQKIPSDGVYGYGPMTGWLNVIPYWAKEAGVRIATGSYVGTGSYGASNPNSLTFGFEPKLVMLTVQKNAGSGDMFLPMGGWWQAGFLWHTGTAASRIDGTSNMTYFNVNKNTLSWYSTVSPRAQLNDSSRTYEYVAIG